MVILITGGCGFVGSSLALSLKESYPLYQIFALDNLKRRGSELNLERLRRANILFYHADIRNKDDLNQIPFVDVIIDAAAEPSVQAGLDGISPDYLLETNFIGTYNCLELARKFNAKFVFLSTSRVYSIPSLDKIDYSVTPTRFEINSTQHISGVGTNGINEFFDISGFRSLYGTTKLASEMLVKEYNALFGLHTVINRCGVLTGPWQMGKVDQGFVVLWLAKHLWKGQLSYIGYEGSGKQVRDILHVSDLYQLIEWQLNHFDIVNGETMNVGGGVHSSVSLLEMTQMCESITNHKINITKVFENRKADIPIYVTDNTKVTGLTGWAPTQKPEEILLEIYSWMVLHEKELRPILQ